MAGKVVVQYPRGILVLRCRRPRLQNVSPRPRPPTQHFGNARGGNLALTTEILLGYCSHAIFPQFHITLLNCVYAFEGINKQNLVELKTILQTYSHERT